MKVIHYINQFFAGIGGEEKANVKPYIEAKQIGPAMALDSALVGAEVTHTIVCGDNYMGSNTEEAVEKILGFLEAEKAGLKEILESRMPKATTEEVVEKPAEEVVTAQISGIEVMDLDEAVIVLWKEKIHAESGMGCTGPIVRISEANKEKSQEILKEKGYL